MANRGHGARLFEDEPIADTSGPVECFGMTFESEEARRAYFLERLREKLKDPEFRRIEGFPIGSDEDILALSDPPYYTACPNPFVGEFIAHYGKPYDPSNDHYRREPFAADVSEGKNDPMYNAHSYHTKVPHKAIMRYILHYTEPGDVVFDGFCGTGMTGVAAQLCANRAAVKSLDYRVLEDDTILDEDGESFSKLGARRPVLNDLCPAATFIAYNYNIPVDVEEFEHDANRILEEVERECGWMYLTLHQPTEEQLQQAQEALRKGPAELTQRADLPLSRTNHILWSDVFVCPECAGEVVFWDAAVNLEAAKVVDDFSCPHCFARLKKKGLGRAWTTRFDPALGEVVRQARQVPVLINYSVGKRRFEKRPDTFDHALLEKIDESNIPYWFPTDRMPEGGESRRNDDIGLTHAHHFYTKQNLWTLAAIWDRIRSKALRSSHAAMLAHSATNPYASKMRRFRPDKKGGGPLAGTLYVSSLSTPPNVILSVQRNLEFVRKAFVEMRDAAGDSIVATQSSTDQLGSSNSIDYIFTDPPFGDNLMYSELNFLWEAWLKIFANNVAEAVENKVQGKGLLEYQELMTRCFEEYYRVLKPGRWMTVEFHNSKNSVWNAIQEALQRAGFVIADVRILDKKQGTFKQITSAAAVKQDLVISAYRPNGGLERRFELESGTEEGVWDFVGTHLRQLPIFVPKDGAMEIVAERMNYLLFDRMVAFHVQRGVTVPLSAAEFYEGLRQRYPERDGMYFTPDQVAEYDRKRLNVRELMELQLFITGEASAIQWLRQELSKKPQTFQELHPEFIKDMGWAKHEKPMELSELLQENFLRYSGSGPIPAQIVSWMKQSARLRPKIQELEDRQGDISGTGFETNDLELLRAAKGRWYVPDPNRSQDLEKLRERTLLKEFEDYKSSRGRLRVFRLEAVRAGFKKAWGERDYKTILDVAHKIPDSVLQEDPKLLMWYDQALTRTEDV